MQDTDLGWKRVLAELDGLNGTAVKVGIQSDAGKEPNGTDILTVAASHEFGAVLKNGGKIPRRPFMAATANDTAVIEGLNQLCDKLVRSVISQQRTARVSLSIIGQWYEQQVKSTIRNFPWIPNAPATIKRKKSSKPLIDHGVMINAIRWAFTSK